MTVWNSVRASRLHERKLVGGDTFIRQATLFPFFDRAGSVRQVLIVDADSSELRTFRLDKTRAWIPLWGSIRLDGPIQGLDEDVMDQLAPLWHYDPKWLLSDARFESQAAVPILKLTNCAEAFGQQPADLLFSVRLTNLRKVSFLVPTRDFQSRGFRPEMLPTRGPTRIPGVETRDAGWQLAPIWQ